MKLYYYLFTLIIISFLSCQTDENSEADTTTNTNKLSLKTGSDSRSVNNAEVLENNMEWVSYFIAEALLTSTRAQGDLVQLMNAINIQNFNGTLKLSDLFVENESTEHFRVAFEERFWCFEVLQSNCGTGGGKPSGRPNPGDHTGLDPNCTDAYCQFLKYILESNCLEIYFPNGFSLSGNNISTTAHPLSNEPFNDVYVHDLGYVNRGTVFNYGYVSGNSLSNYFLNELDNVIVTRPYIDPADCTYNEYSVIDFGNFLRN